MVVRQADRGAGLTCLGKCLSPGAWHLSFQLLRLTDQRAIRYFSENRLRPLTQVEDPERQLAEFRKLLAQAPPLTH